MAKRMKIAVLALVALVAMGTVGYVVYAQTTNGQTTSSNYLARVAAKLGVTEETLLSAMCEAKVDIIDEAVAEGKLTQAQADYLKTVLKAELDYYRAEGHQKRGLGFGPSFGFKGFGRDFGRGTRGFESRSCSGSCSCEKGPRTTGR